MVILATHDSSYVPALSWTVVGCNHVGDYTLRPAILVSHQHIDDVTLPQGQLVRLRGMWHEDRPTRGIDCDTNHNCSVPVTCNTSKHHVASLLVCSHLLGIVVHYGPGSRALPIGVDGVLLCLGRVERVQPSLPVVSQNQVE